MSKKRSSDKAGGRMKEFAGRLQAHAQAAHANATRPEEHAPLEPKDHPAAEAIDNLAHQIDTGVLKALQEKALVAAEKRLGR